MYSLLTVIGLQKSYVFHFLFSPQNRQININYTNSNFIHFHSLIEGNERIQRYMSLYVTQYYTDLSRFSVCMAENSDEKEKIVELLN